MRPFLLYKPTGIFEISIVLYCIVVIPGLTLLKVGLSQAPSMLQNFIARGLTSRNEGREDQFYQARDAMEFFELAPVSIKRSVCTLSKAIECCYLRFMVA